MAKVTQLLPQVHGAQDVKPRACCARLAIIRIKMVAGAVFLHQRIHQMAPCTHVSTSAPTTAEAVITCAAQSATTELLLLLLERLHSDGNNTHEDMHICANKNNNMMRTYTTSPIMPKTKSVSDSNTELNTPPQVSNSTVQYPRHPTTSMSPGRCYLLHYSGSNRPPATS